MMAVEMWKSRRVCEISKGRWEAWKSAVWLSMLSTTPAFPRPSGRVALSRTEAAPEIATCTAGASVPWQPASGGPIRYRSSGWRSAPAGPNSGLA